MSGGGGGQMRLSGGRRLLSPGGRTARPTTSRVREAVMNILAPHLHDCRWLDLCSGSGVMGCEALQRGARCVVAVDQDPQCIRISRSNLSAVAACRSPSPEIRTERRELIAWLGKGCSRSPSTSSISTPPTTRASTNHAFSPSPRGIGFTRTRWWCVNTAPTSNPYRAQVGRLWISAATASAAC